MWIQYDYQNRPINGLTGPPWTRRPHKKSRGGCQECKRRRIKCDEERPQCGQCMASSAACCYSKSTRNGRIDHHADFDDISRSASPLILEGKVSEVDVFEAAIDSIADMQGWPKIASNRTYVELLSHFRNQTVTTISSPTGQEIILSYVTRFFALCPVLLHPVLALTSAHLTSVGAQSHHLQVTSLYHTQLALNLYNFKLHRMRARQERDAVIAPCLILTALFFTSGEPWIFPDPESPNKLAWPTLLSGLWLLFQSPEFQPNESSWLPFIRESQIIVATAPTRAGPGECLVRLLHDIVTESHNHLGDEFLEGERTNSYLPALHALAPVLKAHFDPDTKTLGGPCVDVADFVSLMRFPSHLCSEFIKRLSEHDNTALLLVGFWFALVAQLQHCQWWCLRRALTEGRAIYSCLSKAPPINWKFDQALLVLSSVFADTPSI
ncbi:hypothetical protein NA57DRAFT_55410 [Rhizodiscina lignyota]|uniref:Zn(2)-C6 fungal-type domain-containing protein n=1 Tax=Rhizodiscina lignyota TaxID=1504668 RepID=A0A9P4IGY6_9PEZI|nr:hypothetical protein NA57DRAFT_55410 [Rhizodiscina lignyota]